VTRDRSSVVRLFAVVAAGAIVLSVQLSVGAGDALSIPELMKAKRKGEWQAYAQSGAPMKIEGRYSVFSSTLLRFLNCEDLNFVWFKEDETFPLNTATLRSRNLEVFGRFEMRGGKPAFLVRQVRVLPSDDDSLREKKESLSESPPAAWYALGDWAAARGAFYRDQDLIRQSQELYAEGLRREQSALPEDDLERRLALAPKYQQYGLSDEERVQFVHNALAHRWLSLKETKPTAKALDELSDRVAENLRSCKVAITPQEAPVRDRWVRDPIAAYRTANANDRLHMNRAFWCEVRSAYLDAWAQERNRDPQQLADRIDRELPEFHARAELLRGRALDERLADAVHLTRDEVLTLAEQFQRRGQPEKALLAKRSWVQAKGERLVKEGRPSDLMQAAHEYQSLLDDNASAARLLIQASKIAPDLKEISSQLERLGYKRVDGKWLTAAEAAALPVDAFQKAAEAGRYTGMTREQVRKVFGAPDSRTRSVAAGRLSEVWIYDQGTKSRLAIHFVGSVDGHDVTAVRLVQ
jgi:hypothetical protein